MIDRTVAASGWLVLATHDVCEEPSRWGCNPAFFEDVVCYVARSGATVLPVGDAWDVVRGLPDHYQG